jgi:DNA processing protein
MSLGTIVVEAAEKSGALITAREAADENRFVFAVPGDINRMNSRGANALIQSGARLVQRAEDVLSEMQAVLRGYLREEDFLEKAGEGGTSEEDSDSSKPFARRSKVVRRTPPAMSAEETTVYEILRHEPQYFDALLARVTSANIPQQKLSTLLLNLELKQLIKQLPGQLYTVLE